MSYKFMALEIIFWIYIEFLNMGNAIYIYCVDLRASLVTKSKYSTNAFST